MTDVYENIDMFEDDAPEAMADSSANLRPLALVTGASSGIGYELARIAAQEGYDLIVAADDSGIVEAAQAFRSLGNVEALPIQADLSTIEGVDMLLDAVGGRPLDILMANAGQGLGHGFLDQDWDAARKVVDTNITGTLYLLHEAAPAMVERGRGRILITGSSWPSQWGPRSSTITT